jgi:uncharacterized protein YndB with AHSA1/START domain
MTIKAMKITGALVAALALVQAVRAADLVGPVTVTRLTSPQKMLRFEVNVPASVDDVWAAFTTQAGLATWLWRDTRVELRPGGEWLAVFPTSTAGGTIVSFVPKRTLVIAALAPEQFPTVRAARTTATFSFQALTAESTAVTLTQSGWQSGSEWDAAYEYLAKGNAELLTQLQTRFVSGPIKWP